LGLNIFTPVKNHTPRFYNEAGSRHSSGSHTPAWPNSFVGLSNAVVVAGRERNCEAAAHQILNLLYRFELRKGDVSIIAQKVKYFYSTVD
jgi:hypothetical protein